MPIARSTPAQKPRGLASRTSMAVYFRAFARRRPNAARRGSAAPRVGEKAERGAAVVREHQVEERRDLAHLAEAQARADRDLARLVRQREEQRESEPRGDALQARRDHANRRGSPEP